MAVLRWFVCSLITSDNKVQSSIITVVINEAKSICTEYLKRHQRVLKNIVLGILILFISTQAQSRAVDFDPDVQGEFGTAVQAMALQDDGKIFITGFFNSVGGVMRSNVARIDANGDVDLSFNGVLSGIGEAMAVQSDGKLIVAGQFNTAGGQTSYTRNKIVRFNTDGSVDPDFDPDINNPNINNFNTGARAVAIQDDGKILIGGLFSMVGGVAITNFARLNIDGSVDTSFANLGVNGVVNAIELQDDGQIVIGGNFTSVGGEVRTRVARLNSIDGSLDTSFMDPEVNDSVFALGIQDNGGIIVGGDFTAIGERLIRRVGRLDSGGSRDDNFIPSFPPTRIANIVIQADGKIIIGGRINRPNFYFVRLEENGAVETGFSPKVTGSQFYSVLIQGDGKILVAGTFTRIGLFERNNIARLNSDGTVESNAEPICNAIKAVNGAVAVICL